MLGLTLEVGNVGNLSVRDEILNWLRMRLNHDHVIKRAHILIVKI